MKIKKLIEEALLEKIKFVDNDEHIYYGTPEELINIIYKKIKKNTKK